MLRVRSLSSGTEIKFSAEDQRKEHEQKTVGKTWSYNTQGEMRLFPSQRQGEHLKNKHINQQRGPPEAQGWVQAAPDKGCLRV